MGSNTLREVLLLTSKLGDYSFDIGPIRPPNEGGSFSLLLRVTRNCPWRLCSFCYGTPYGRRKFELRSVDEVKRDIDNVKAIVDLLTEISFKLGLGGKINWDVWKVISTLDLTLNYNFNVINVINWISSGGRTVFLQDADSLIIPVKDLAEIVKYIKFVFPQVKRITSYARSKTLSRKSFEDLKLLRGAGLSRLHVGLESGDDEVLRLINKGVTSEEHIKAGKLVLNAGMELSEYVMVGVAGKELSEQHAKNTAKVLNVINPSYVRIRTCVPLPGTPLHKEYKDGNFKLLSPRECLMEIRNLIENLNINGRLCFDHFANPSFKGNIPVFKQDYEGYKLPEEKFQILETVERALKMDESRFRWTEELVGLEHL
ncbi:MAG: radical SAM protein [Candidatus Bathyarchaeota archaeon]